MITDPPTIGDIRRKKFVLTNLFLQKTRRCNFRCKICCNGEQQDFSMKPKTEDNILGFFKNVPISNIGLVGGEPSFDLGSLAELYDALKRNDTWFYHLGLFTNGSNPSQEFFDAIDRISDLALEDPEFFHKISIHKTERLSHKQEHERLGLDYEGNRQKFDELIARYPHFYKIPALDPMFVNAIVKCGNAAKAENFEYLENLDESLFEPVEFGREKLEFQRFPGGHLALDGIKFNAKGDILPNTGREFANVEYITEERNNFGNINREDLTEVLINNGELEIIR